MAKGNDREKWRTRVERLLATDMTVAEWCKANKHSESSMFKWVGYFADHEPELFGGVQNIADRDSSRWITKTRENMRASTALAVPGGAGGGFVRIEAASLAPGRAAAPPAVITVAVNGAEVGIPAGCDERDIAAVLKAVAYL